ncbi:hypothetical protein Q8F55_002659 [Vanrija albida]|uniref:WW domain-containing protein n=1 Tax=Vanrija albida TaxID=181172 RepID=A0ABR3QBF4_9TREE
MADEEVDWGMEDEAYGGYGEDDCLSLGGDDDYAADTTPAVEPTAPPPKLASSPVKPKSAPLPAKPVSPQKPQSAPLPPKSASRRSPTGPRAAESQSPAQPVKAEQPAASSSAPAKVQTKTTDGDPREPETQPEKGADEDEPLPEGWQRVMSVSQGKYFYYHVDSGRTSWDNPSLEANGKTETKVKEGEVKGSNDGPKVGSSASSRHPETVPSRPIRLLNLQHYLLAPRLLYRLMSVTTDQGRVRLTSDTPTADQGVVRRPGANHRDRLTVTETASEVNVFPNAGHGVMTARPAQYRRAIASLLGQRPAPRSPDRGAAHQTGGLYLLENRVTGATASVLTTESASTSAIVSTRETASQTVDLDVMTGQQDQRSRPDVMTAQRHRHLRFAPTTGPQQAQHLQLRQHRLRSHHGRHRRETAGRLVPKTCATRTAGPGVALPDGHRQQQVPQTSGETVSAQTI